MPYFPSFPPMRRLAIVFGCLCALVIPHFMLLRTASAQSGATRKTDTPTSDEKPNQKLPDEKQKGQSSGKSGIPGGPNQDRPQGTPRRRPPTKPTQEDTNGEVIKVETNVVSVDVVVYDKKSGKIFTNLKPTNFTVLEDGVKQDVTNFSPSDGAITMVMVLEYSRVIGPLVYEVLEPAAQFVERFVQPKDYVSIVPFDIRPKVLNDFSNDPAELRSSISLLYKNVPAFSESNLFDTMKFVIKGGKLDGEEYTGLEEVQGRRAILLIALGIDTFSKINYDQTRKIVEGAGVPVYVIGIGNFFYKRYDGQMAPETSMTFLQAFNTLKTFAKSSGGEYYGVTFPGEIPTTLRSISALMRNQYSLGYEPTNTRREGKRRKVEILVDVNGDGQPDNKDLVVQYRPSYTEPGGKDDKKKK